MHSGAIHAREPTPDFNDCHTFFVDRPVTHLTIRLLVVTLLVFQRGKPDNGSLCSIMCHSL